MSDGTDHGELMRDQERAQATVAALVRAENAGRLLQLVGGIAALALLVGAVVVWNELIDDEVSGDVSAAQQIVVLTPIATGFLVAVLLGGVGTALRVWASGQLPTRPVPAKKQWE